MSKETYYRPKKSKKLTTALSADLLQCQKRPTTVSKETYYRPKKSKKLTTALSAASMLEWLYSDILFVTSSSSLPPEARV